MTKRKKFFLIFLFLFLLISLIIALALIKKPTKITKKASEPTFPKIEKFNPPPIQQQYQLIAHGFHNTVGELKETNNWWIYTPDFIDFVDRKICDISNGLEGEEPQNCNVKNEGGIQIVRLSGAMGLVIKDDGNCNFSGSFYTEDGTLKAAYPNKRAQSWNDWLKLIEKIKTQTNADIFISVDFPDYCTKEQPPEGKREINDNDLQYLLALVDTAIEKLANQGLLEAVKYWNYGNEPGISRLTQISKNNPTNGQYLLSVFSDAFARKVKNKCDTYGYNCKVILGGPASYSDYEKNKVVNFFNKFLREIRDKNTPFDGFDFHWHHQCLFDEQLNYYKIRDYFNWFVNIVSQAFGIDPATLKESKEFVITENSEIYLESIPSSCGNNIEDICEATIGPVYNQNHQASALIKRILTAFASGVKKVSYTSLIEAPYGNNDCSYFSHTGLLDAYGNERLSFKGLEILAEKIYGASKIEWDSQDYNDSKKLEIIKIYYDNNQNPEAFVLWTRFKDVKNINLSTLFNEPLNSPPYVVLKINQQNIWQKKLHYQNSLTLDGSPTFVYKPLNCTAATVSSFSFLNNATFKGYDENQTPIWEIDNNSASLRIKVNSPERKIKVLALRKKIVSEDSCGATDEHLLKKWISPSLVKEMEVSTDVSFSLGEYYLYLVAAGDFRGCSGDPAASPSNGFCAAGLGNLNNAKIKVIVRDSNQLNLTPAPELSPTPTPTNTPIPTSTPEPFTTPTLTPTPTSIPILSPTPTLTPTPTFTPMPTPTNTPIPAPAPILQTYCPSSCPQIFKISAGKIAQNNCWVFLSWETVPNAQKYRIIRNNSYYRETSSLAYFWTSLPCNNNSLYRVIPINNNCELIDCPGIAIKTP